MRRTTSSTRVLPYSNQQVSMTHGGPIMRDRFHYFANYEFERQVYSTVFTTPYPEFNLQFTAPREEHKAGLRLDYQFNPGFRASLRGAIWQNDQQIDQGFEGSSTDHPSFLVHTYRDSDQIQLTLTNVLGSRAVNEVRTGYVGSPQPRGVEGAVATTSVGRDGRHRQRQPDSHVPGLPVRPPGKRSAGDPAGQLVAPQRLHGRRTTRADATT